MNLYDIVSPMTMAEAKTDYEKRRQRERDVDAGKPVAKQRQPKMTDYQKKRAQDKKDMELGEAMGYESDKRYMLAGKHNIYDIYVGKKKFNDVTGFIAVAVHPRTKDATRFNAPTQQGAIEKAKAEINKIVDTAPKISGAATIDFNVDFKRDILEMSDLPFYAKIIPGPKLVIAGKEMEQYPDIMKAEGFKKSSPRSEKGNKLPGVDLSSSSAKAIQIVANGRYVLGNETIDKDGNRVFDLDLDSTVAGKGDMAFLKTPGFTIGTPRAKNEDAWHAGDNAWSSDNHEMVEGQLNVGDPVVVTASNEFEGKTGEIAEFSPSGKFVVVDLYNHGQHSMHLSDVAYNDYADVQDDVEGWEDDYHDEYYADLKEVGVDEGFQDFNKVEPYAVCLAGKPVKKFDYYEQARRFHDNWKQKLYREGNKAKADTITLMPLNLDEAMNVNDLLNKVTKDSNKNFKKAKAGKLKASGDFTKGDHWTGPDKDDPSYTKNFGHGYPDTPSNRSHDRYVKKSLKKGVAEETREAELNRKFNSPEQLKKDADYRAYRAGVKASRKQPPTPLPVKEDWIDDNAAEPLARYFADLYYGDFSATEKVKLTAYIYQSIQNGKLSIDQLKADIDMLEKEKGIKEQGVAEGIVDTIRSKNYARLADRSADKRATALDNFDEPEHQKQTDIMKQRNLKSRLLNKKGVAEADETSWTANSAQFRKEEDMSWPVEITLEPNADINQGRGRQVKTMTVTGQSRDAAKKKLVDYFLKNGWTVTGIKFTGDLDEQGVVEGTGQWIVKYWDKRPENTPAEDKFGSEEQARAFLAKLPAHYVKALRQERSVAEVSDQTLQNYKDKAIPAFYDAVAKDNAKTANKRGQGISKASHKQARRAGGSYAFHEDVSRLSDAEYNRVAAYVRKKYPGTQLSGLGRNPDGSFNVMIDTGSGRHEFKVRFREPEETDIKENDPCWKDYKQVGMKTKGGKQVPNCVPKESVQESYWTKLQNERNTKLNSLVNELKESIKK